jgi:hypothetical protein
MPRTLRTLAAAVLVTGLFGAGPAVADETTADPTAGAPEVGACYDLTLEQAAAEAAAEAPVACAGRHTMVVTALGELPAPLDWATVNYDKAPKALSQALAQTCDPAVAKLIGPERARALTMYDTFFFAPTDAEIAAGARWFSCAVALVGDGRLVAFPDGHPTKLGRSIPAAVGRCASFGKGGYRTVACTQRHKWRATYAQRVHAKPTDKNIFRAANRVCPRQMTTRKDWLYTDGYRTKTSFFVVCMDKTRR